MLLGSFPNAKPHSVDGYLKALAATLAQYPAELAFECADPRTGIARSFRYQAPNVADVIDWCDKRLAFHRAMSTWQPRIETKRLSPPESPELREKVLSFLRSLAERFSRAPDPLAELHRARAAGIAAERRAIVGELPGVPTDDELRKLYSPKTEVLA